MPLIAYEDMPPDLSAELKQSQEDAKSARLLLDQLDLKYQVAKKERDAACTIIDRVRSAVEMSKNELGAGVGWGAYERFECGLADRVIRNIESALESDATQSARPKLPPGKDSWMA